MKKLLAGLFVFCVICFTTGISYADCGCCNCESGYSNAVYEHINDSVCDCQDIKESTCGCDKCKCTKDCKCGCQEGKACTCGCNKAKCNCKKSKCSKKGCKVNKK